MVVEGGSGKAQLLCRVALEQGLHGARGRELTQYARRKTKTRPPIESQKQGKKKKEKKKLKDFSEDRTNPSLD